MTVELFETGADETELVLTHEQLPPAWVARHIEGWTAIVETLAAQWASPLFVLSATIGSMRVARSAGR